VKAAGILVILLVELSTRVQPGQDQFNARDFFFRVDIDRHTATVISDLKGSVFVQGNGNFLAVTCQRLVNAVVDNFVCQVIRPGCVGIHARPAADRLKATQDLDVGRIVSFAHLLIRPKR
jgi:hypothetical protein